jgi:2-dehydropantoate 2-reductase
VTATSIAVLGPGGVGGVVASLTGALCVGTERTVEAIRRDGLTLVRDGERSVAHPEAVARLDRPVSLLVVAVKAHDLEPALDRIAPGALEGALVLPLQNGLEQVERIRACASLLQAPTATVVAGAIGRLEAWTGQPGVVVLRGPGAPRITAASDVVSVETLERSLAPLRVAGLELAIGVSERAVLWEKVARLAPLAAATAASALDVGELRGAEPWRTRLRAAVDEACAVAAAEGVPIDPADQWAIIEALPSDLTTSTARDARAGRPTELDAISGSVARAGKRLGVPTLSLEALLEEARCRTPSR